MGKWVLEKQHKQNQNTERLKTHKQNVNVLSGTTKLRIGLKRPIPITVGASSSMGDLGKAKVQMKNSQEIGNGYPDKGELG